MNLSEEEFAALVEAAADFDDYHSTRYFVKRDPGSASGDQSPLQLRDPSVLPPWAFALRRMFSALADLEFGSRRRSPLAAICEAGGRHGFYELEATIAPTLLALVSQKARRRLKQNLKRILEQVTGPSLELERRSYSLALTAIGLQKERTSQTFSDHKFLGRKPSDRLFSLFKRFPVLARLWSQLIIQWRDQANELLIRLRADRTALSRALLGGQVTGPIVDLHCGLSDPHNGGRTVMLLRFAAGSAIYKPRSGDSEWEWFSFLKEINARSFQPQLKVARVLRRKRYSWMEWIEPSSCKNKSEARRFYRRMGGIIGAAYLLKATDCHRDNVIASGEHPVLIDAEGLYHFSLERKAETSLDRLRRTGFFPSSDRRSLQSRSSVLRGLAAVKRTATIRGEALDAAEYKEEIVEGFSRAWRCALGTKSGRAALVRRLQRISSRKRRWIYRATEEYAAIMRASIQPAAVRSGIERELLIARLCSRRTAPSSIIHAEINALKRLDIPYLLKRTKKWPAPAKETVLIEVIEGLHRTLGS
ncbi:MAG TPA: type 2 lanthipeptide synthetase LanM [Chthoniobacterales bacterium]|nr:type 2 lanthipeptide synthetase LanM [Chthoniobacterales bacterium]